MSDNKLFQRLLRRRMHPDDVSECLKMSQHDFLAALSDGVSKTLGHRVTRKEFATLAGITERNAYAYFSSTDARDYRALSDDARIAMIWRITNRVKPKRTGEASASKYLLNGSLVTIKTAAEIIGYSGPKSLLKAIRAAGLKPGDDISGIKKSHSRAAKKYIVNGELVSISQASILLGYKARNALVDRLANIEQGTDISHMKKGSQPVVRRKPNTYTIHGDIVTAKEAAKILGYSSKASLLTILYRHGIKSGEDITFLAEMRCLRRQDDE